MSARLLIRADGSSRIGAGHVLRCLALAQAWKDEGGTSLFACSELSAPLSRRVRAEGFECEPVRAQPGSAEDASATVSLARGYKAGWIVADGYGFGPDFQHALKAAGLRLVLLDDYGHAGEYAADIVLNQNPGAEESLYARRDAGTRLLLGPGYALLRREFLAARAPIRGEGGAKYRILVTFGNADPDNVTEKAIAALGQIPDSESIVVVGSDNPHLGMLREAIRDDAVRIAVDVRSMPELMAWADVAVSGAGSTSLEMAMLGLPMILIVLGQDQRASASGLEQQGVATNLGWHQAVSPRDITHAVLALRDNPEQGARMAERGRHLVDGHGARRVAQLLMGQCR